MTTRKTSRGAGDQRAAGQPDRAAGIPVTVVSQVADGEHAAQAEIEGVATEQFVEFEGELFRLASRVSYLPIMKFAHYASKGTDSASMQGLAAMYEMLRGCFDRGEPCGKDECEFCSAGRERECETRKGDEWPRFQDHAIAVGADDEQLFAVVSDVLERVSARPTQPRSGSQQPARRTSANSKARSSLPAGAQDLLQVNDLAR